MHVGDLDGLGSPVNRKNWSATVSVLAHDAQDNPLAGASVSGSWSTGASTACVTDGTGRCNLSSGNISTSTGSAVLTITNISYPGSSYDPAANHDPDGDSSGSVIAVARP